MGSVSETRQLDFRALFERAQALQFVLDPQLRVVSVSDGYLALLGLERDELVGRPIAEVMPEPPRDPAAAMFQHLGASLRRVLQTRAPDVMPVQRLHDPARADLQQVRQGRPVNTPVIGPNGEVSFIVHRVEEVSAAAEHPPGAGWRGVFDSLPDLATVIDNDQRIVRVNRAMAEQLGLSVGECIGRKCFECIHGMDEPPFQCPHLLTCQDGEPHMAEAHENRLGGEFLISTTPLRDASGTVVGTLHVARDISQRHGAEHALLESENRFRALADSVPAMIWKSGPVQGCNYFNRRWLEFTGRPLEQELGAGWTEGVHPEDRSACLAAYANAFECRQPFQREFRLRHHSGEYRWVEDHGAPRCSPGGVLLGFMGGCFDVQERKQDENRLREWVAQLQSRLEAEVAHWRPSFKAA